MTEDDLNVDKFYVFRRLNIDESWGAVLIDGGSVTKIPNIDFGMRIFARNEKEAIAKGKFNYDKIHIHDSDKESVRRFAASALRRLIDQCSPCEAATKSMEYAVEMNKEFNKHFEMLEKGNDNE